MAEPELELERADLARGQLTARALGRPVPPGPEDPVLYPLPELGPEDQGPSLLPALAQERQPEPALAELGRVGLGILALAAQRHRCGRWR